MQKSYDRDLVEFSIKLDRLLMYAHKVYESYKESGNKFCFAKVLFEINSRISELLYDFIDVIPEAQKKDAVELMFHIDVWKEIWLDEASQRQPKHNEHFAFPNEITFPKKSVERLLAIGIRLE